MNLPLSACTMAEYDKIYAEYEPPQKNMPKNKKNRKFQKYVISNPGLPQYTSRV
jgi:hypothetical protein